MLVPFGVLLQKRLQAATQRGAEHEATVKELREQVMQLIHLSTCYCGWLLPSRI